MAKRKVPRARMRTKRGKSSLFHTPRVYKKYENIVSLKSKKAAANSIQRLRKEFKEAETQEKRTRVQQVTLAAANIGTYGMGKNLHYKPKTRQEKKEIGKLYLMAYEDMK